MRGILCAEKDVIKFSERPKLDIQVGCPMISANFKSLKLQRREDETDFLVIEKISS